METADVMFNCVVAYLVICILRDIVAIFHWFWTGTRRLSVTKDTMAQPSNSQTSPMLGKQLANDLNMKDMKEVYLLPGPKSKAGYGQICVFFFSRHMFKMLKCMNDIYIYICFYISETTIHPSQVHLTKSCLGTSRSSELRVMEVCKHCQVRMMKDACD